MQRLNPTAVERRTSCSSERSLRGRSSGRRALLSSSDRNPEFLRSTRADEPVRVRILFVDLFPVSAITRPGSWYNHPTRWFGMHAAAQFFLEDMPLSLFLLVMGRVLSVLFEAVAVRLVPRISTTSTPTIATFK